jgi:hypothetical protein
LRYYVEKADCDEQVDLCTEAEEWAESLKLKRGKSFDSPVKTRLIACFQHGLDLERDCWCTRGCTSRLVQHFLQAGKAKLLESALLEHGKSPEIIASILEEGKYGTIVDELDQLRPARNVWKYGFRFKYFQRKMEQHERHVVVALYRKHRAMAIDEGYRKYFPEDWAEIEDLTSQFDKLMLEKKPLPRPNPEVEGSLPAINGLGEDFWNR